MLKIADGKYCNDRDVESGKSWSSSPSASFNYVGYKRLYKDYTPTLNCSLNDLYTSKVGLIMADEVEFSGCKNAINTSYYLFNGQNYWTISPYQWYYGSSTSLYARVFAVNSDGYFGYWNVDYTHGVRPVINLKSDITISSGNGTIDNPYIVN